MIVLQSGEKVSVEEDVDDAVKSLAETASSAGFCRFEREGLRNKGRVYVNPNAVEVVREHGPNETH